MIDESKVRELLEIEAKASAGEWRDKPSIHCSQYRYVQFGSDVAYTTLELLPFDAKLITAMRNLIRPLAESYLRSQSCRHARLFLPITPTIPVRICKDCGAEVPSAQDDQRDLQAGQHTSTAPSQEGHAAGLAGSLPNSKRDSHRGGSSYEASMLRNLLARIHRDGGHCVERHGLDKALEDAEAKVVEWLAMTDTAAVANAGSIPAESASDHEKLTPRGDAWRKYIASPAARTELPEEPERFWVRDASNLMVVRASDYDALRARCVELAAERDGLRHKALMLQDLGNTEAGARVEAERQLAALSQWIPVGERLPEAEIGELGRAPIISGDVAVLFEAGDSLYDIANYDHEIRRWSLPNRDFEEPDAEPTHWRELPPPPEK